MCLYIALTFRPHALPYSALYTLYFSTLPPLEALLLPNFFHLPHARIGSAYYTLILAILNQPLSLADILLSPVTSNVCLQVPPRPIPFGLCSPSSCFACHRQKRKKAIRHLTSSTESLLYIHPTSLGLVRVKFKAKERDRERDRKMEEGEEKEMDI